MFCLGSGPFFCCFWCFAVCFAVSAGETQVWLEICGVTGLAITWRETGANAPTISNRYVPGALQRLKRQRQLSTLTRVFELHPVRQLQNFHSFMAEGTSAEGCESVAQTSFPVGFVTSKTCRNEAAVFTAPWKGTVALRKKFVQHVEKRKNISIKPCVARKTWERIQQETVDNTKNGL